MKLKKLMNADILMKNIDNQVKGEHVKNIVPNDLYFVEHSIYFAESLRVYEDEEKKKSLIEGSDYNFAEIDSIASEMANKDCYRAVVFLSNVEQAWIDYHSYGDVVSADTLNELVQGINSGMEVSDELKTSLAEIKKNLQTHIDDRKPHGAAVTAEADSLALRTDRGAMKVAEPESDDEAVNLGHQSVAIQEAKTEIDNQMQAAHQAIWQEMETLEDKVTAKEAVLTIDDFLPENFEDLLLAEQNTAMQEAQETLNSELEKTEAGFNIIRNKNGSVSVPDAVDEKDAINKKEFDEKVKKHNEDVEALDYRMSGLKDNLSEALKALENAEGHKDIFQFKDAVFAGQDILFGEAVKTNKEWQGKTVWRAAAHFSFTFNNTRKKLQKYILVENLNNNERLTHDDIKVLFLDGVVEEKALPSAGAYGDDSFYSLRDVASTIIKKTVPAATPANTWWIDLSPKTLKTYIFNIWIEFVKVE